MLRAAAVWCVFLTNAGAAPEPGDPVPLDDFPARLAAVYPADGSTGVPNETTLCLRFDEPVNPDTLTLSWDRGGFLDVGSVSSRAERHELLVPATLLSGTDHQVGLGERHWNTLTGDDGLKVAAESWGFSTADDTPEADPAVESIEPADGSEVARVTWLTLRFDQPVEVTQGRLEIAKTVKVVGKMNRLSTRIEGLPIVRASEDQKSIRLPVVFPLGWEGDLRITLGGAEPITVGYKVGEQLVDWEDPAFGGLSDSESTLRDVVQRTREARRQLRSAEVESSAVMMSTASVKGQLLPFQRATFKTGRFRFQGDNQFVGDVSGWMGIPFQVGSDGQKGWFLSKRRDDEGERRMVLRECDAELIEDCYVAIADAFSADRKDTDQVIEDRRLTLVGSETIEGTPCHVIRSWKIQATSSNDDVWVTATDWLIDAESFLPRRVVRYAGHGHKQVTDLRYRRLNETMNDAEFAPPEVDAVERVGPEPLGEGYTKRFLKISDGSDGRVSTRWGKRNESGRVSSSGLN